MTTAVMWSAAPVHAALFVLFSPAHAHPGDRIEVRTGGTPAEFTNESRERPLQKPLTVFLVPNAIAADISGRQDPRLTLLGILHPDKNGHARATFTVPRLDADVYAAAFYCPGCFEFSGGATFSSLPVDENALPEWRPFMTLTISSDDVTGSGWLIASVVAGAAGWLLAGLLLLQWKRTARLS